MGDVGAAASVLVQVDVRRLEPGWTQAENASEAQSALWSGTGRGCTPGMTAVLISRGWSGGNTVRIHQRPRAMPLLGIGKAVLKTSTWP